MTPDDLSARAVLCLAEALKLALDRISELEEQLAWR